LVALFPSQASAFDSLLADDLAKISNKNERANGVSLGQRAAAAILALRANDARKSLSRASVLIISPAINPDIGDRIRLA